MGTVLLDRPTGQEGDEERQAQEYPEAGKVSRCMRLLWHVGVAFTSSCGRRLELAQSPWKISVRFQRGRYFPSKPKKMVAVSPVDEEGNGISPLRPWLKSVPLACVKERTLALVLVITLCKPTSLKSPGVGSYRSKLASTRKRTSWWTPRMSTTAIAITAKNS